MEKGFILRQAIHVTMPNVVCESCGQIIDDYKMAWVMWPELMMDGATVKPTILCKTNGCNSKAPYDGYPSMELRDYLINLCQNTGMRTEEDFHEAIEFTNLSDRT